MLLLDVFHGSYKLILNEIMIFLLPSKIRHVLALASVIYVKLGKKILIIIC